MLMLSANGKIMDANNALLKISGYSRDEIVGKNAIDFVVQEQRQETAAQIETASSKGEAPQFEVMIRSKDGSTRTLLLPPTQLVLEEGKRSFLVMGVDITERKQAEETMSHLAAIVESSNDAIIGKTLDGVITSWNRGAEKLYGYSAEEAKGKLISILIPPNRPDELAKILERIKRGESVQLYETQRMRKDGTTIEVSLAVSPIRDSIGRIVGASTIARDITERKRMLKALQESEERYRALVENSPNLIGIFQDGILKYVNSAGILKLGWTAEEVISPTFDPIENVVSQKSRSLLKENVGKRLRGEDVTPYEITLTRKDGSNLLVLVRGAKIIYHQKPAIEFVFDDITERKKAEEKLRQSEERYHSLFDRMLDGFYLSTHEGRFVDVNPAFVKMFGYASTQEMLDIEDIKRELYFSPEERGRHILDTDQEEVKEYRMRRKDGSEIWVEDHGHYVHDEQGNIIYHEGILRDITDRKRAEEKARVASRYARSLIEASLDPLVTISADGKITDVNKATELVTETSRDQLIGSNFSNYFTEPEKAEEEYIEVFAKGFIKDYPLAIRSKSGKVTEVLYNATVYRDEVGKTRGVFAAARDITERKRLEEELKRHSLHLEDMVAERTGELRESEERYRGLFEACPVSLWEEDFSAVKVFLDELRQKGVSDFGTYFTNHPEDVAKCAGLVKVLNMNKATLNLYNAKSMDEIIGGLSRVLTEEGNRVFADELVAFAEGENYYEAETESRTLQGETKHGNLICAVAPGYEQSLAKVLISVADLTPQKQMEEELLAAKERLEYVIATNPAVLVLEKPLPDLSNTFSTFVSDSATSVLGFEPKNFLGEPGSEFFNSRIPPADLAQYLAEIPLLWRDGHHAFEFRFLHSDGAYRWLREEMKVTRDAEGHIRDVVGVCIDVTDRKKLEEKLAKAERLATIGETAAMVGHDLRNPLQGITGALYLLKQESLTAEERDEMLQVIEKSVHYSDAIVKDLLDYSAEIKLQLVEVTPKSITRNAIGAVRVPQNVKVQDLSEYIPTLRVDPDMMKRVFVNLFENAFDAMPQGGTLTISSKKSDANVEIALMDTGSGISKEAMENLWKPLQTTKAQGMGFGLAICKRIIDAHGGNISARSEVGRGTTITIHLPLGPIEVKQK
jgi:PAS domain S-box-containing protein